MNEIVLSKNQFLELQNLVYQSSGINLHEGKKELLKSKLAKRMRLTRKNFDQYLAYLASNEQEVVEFIDTVTTNHSYFFRENNSIAYMVHHFKTIATKKNQVFKIWCAACSTGDEPYSIAMQLLEAGLDFSILATDISHSVLTTAVRGIYRIDKTRDVPKALLHRYFQQGTGKYQGHVKIKKQVQAHINFERFNLITDTPPGQGFDAVVCRNVMIYFDLPTSERVVNKLYGAVAARGFFAIGNAESLMNLTHKFSSIPKVPSLYVK
jgi:chemotaxis protein methyltransferase CheR